MARAISRRQAASRHDRIALVVVIGLLIGFMASTAWLLR
jgi:hypothetical protein